MTFECTFMKPFPWQKEHWHNLCLANQTSKMAHAILFTGPVGIGLQHFSKCLTTSLLCQNSNDNLHICGNCRSCHLIQGESHPDLFNVAPEHTGKQIKVSEVRKLIDYIHLKSQYGGYKIAVITPADAMNRNAANSLLKILEEPPEHSLLILLSHKPNLLPITVKSRCQYVRFKPAFDEETVRWVNKHQKQQKDAKYLLNMAGGAPLAIEDMLESNALERHKNILDDLFSLKKRREDPIKIAEKWKSYDALQVLLWLSQLFAEMARIKLKAQPARIYDATTIDRLQELIKQLELYELTGFYHLLLEKYGTEASTIGYNTQGLLEDVIVSWQSLNDNRRRIDQKTGG